MTESELPAAAKALLDKSAEKVAAANSACAQARVVHDRAKARLDEAEADLQAARDREQSLLAGDELPTAEQFAEARQAVDRAEAFAKAVDSFVARFSARWSAAWKALEAARSEAVGPVRDLGIKWRIQASRDHDTVQAMRLSWVPGAPADPELLADADQLETDAAARFAQGTACVEFAFEKKAGGIDPNFAKAAWPQREVDERGLWGESVVTRNDQLEYNKRGWSAEFAWARARRAFEQAKANPKAPVRQLSAKWKAIHTWRENQQGHVQLYNAIQFEALALEWAERIEPAAAE